ncbi:MAG: hypothetical protein ACLFU0_01305 [Alphaproteobacteria bacterium]
MSRVDLSIDVETTGLPAAARPFGVLEVAPGVEETYHTRTACHCELRLAQQGPTREHRADP